MCTSCAGGARSPGCIAFGAHDGRMAVCTVCTLNVGGPGGARGVSHWHTWHTCQAPSSISSVASSLSSSPGRFSAHLCIRTSRSSTQCSISTGKYTNEQPSTCVLRSSFFENTNRFTIHIRLLNVDAVSPQGDQIGLDLGSLNFEPLPFSVPLVRTRRRIGTLAHQKRLFRKLVLCLVLGDY